MAVRQQKNVRLPEGPVEVLRALKYDQDASDGDVIADALRTQALRRIQHLLALIRREELGLSSTGRVAALRATVGILVAALNTDGEQYRVVADCLETAGEDGSWLPSPSAPRWDIKDPSLRDWIVRRAQLLTELRQPRINVGILVLAACEQTGADRYSALGVPAQLLATHLRNALADGPGAPVGGALQVTWPAKVVMYEAATGLAAIEGVETIGPEHILVAGLQSDEAEVSQAARTLHLTPDLTRGLLTRGWSGIQPDLRDERRTQMAEQVRQWERMLQTYRQGDS